MATYMMVHKGEATGMSVLTGAGVAAAGAAWDVWMRNVGPALVDVGTPFGPGVSVVDDGSTGSAISLSGYSIVEADDRGRAQAFANKRPLLCGGEGIFAVDAYAPMPTPMMD